jgi:hypothetical protein
MKPPYTRNDIAVMFNLSVRQVRENEARLGLDKARIQINSRVVRYRAAVVLRILRTYELV